MENIPFEAPRDLNYFLEQFKCEDISSDGNEDQTSMGPTIISYKAGHPVQDSEMVRWMEDHRILTRVILFRIYRDVSLLNKCVSLLYKHIFHFSLLII